MFSIVGWDAAQDSVDGPELFCGHFELRKAESGGKRVFECLGHDVSAGMVQAAAGTHIPVVACSFGDGAPPRPTRVGASDAPPGPVGGTGTDLVGRPASGSGDARRYRRLMIFRRVVMLMTTFRTTRGQVTTEM